METVVVLGLVTANTKAIFKACFSGTPFVAEAGAGLSDLAKQVSADPTLKDKFRLLSISFDPENDTPQKLRAYGIGYLGNDANAKFDVWQLAVGSDPEVKKIADFFGLRYERNANDRTVIDHSLRTVVISPSGKVTKVFAGNDWTPAQLLREMQAAATS